MRLVPPFSIGISEPKSEMAVMPRRTTMAFFGLGWFFFWVIYSLGLV